MLKYASTLMIAVLLGGCATTEVYDHVAAEYGASVSKSAELLEQDIRRKRQVLRAELILDGHRLKQAGQVAKWNSSLQQQLEDYGISDPVDGTEAFVALFTCTPDTTLSPYSAALRAIASHAQIIRDAATAPEQDIGSLMASIETYGGDVESRNISPDFQRALEQEDARARECLKNVVSDVRLIRNLRLREAAPELPDEGEEMAAIPSNVKEAFAQIKSLVVVLLSAVDEFQRTRFIQDFVQDNQETIDQMILLLGDASWQMSDLFVEARRAEFAAAYLELIALSEFSMSPSESLRAASELGEQLTVAKMLRAPPKYSLVFVGLEDAHNTLKRLAAGDLTREEIKSLYRELSTHTQAIKAAMRGLGD